MRVAMVSEHASPLAAIGGVDAGGQNLHVAELATALIRGGHEVTVYTRRDRADLPEQVATDAGYDVVHVPAGPATPVGKDALLPHMGAFGQWMARHWAECGPPEVVHAHFWMSGIAAREATAAGGVPVVLTYHALGSVKRRHQRSADTSPPERIPLERRLGKSVDRVVAQCPDEVDELVRLGVPGGNIAVIPSGVDLSRFQPSGPLAPRRPGLRRVLTAGRLVARKGYDDLIRAVAYIPGVELVVVGGPPEGIEADGEARRLTRLARSLGVADRVSLVGAVPHSAMPNWYRSADLLACTPWYEPFGLTPLEAMACGIPVVTYAVGGLRHSVVDGVCGVHVPPGDVAALTQAIRELLADEPRRQRLGRAGLARTQTYYAWDRTAKQLADVYADVVSRTQRERVVS